MKILNSIFPIYFWLFLFAGISLLFINENPIYSHIILNFISVIFFVKLGIVIHEIGHLIFAKLVGGSPKRIVLGKSHEVVRFDVKGIKIILNKDFNGGFAFANFNQDKKSKWRRFLYVSGGFLTNILIAYLCYLVFGFSLSFMSGKGGMDLSSAFIFANIILAVISLIPYYVNYEGIKIPTDGLTLLKLPFAKTNEVNIDYNDFFEAMHYYESKDYDRAIQLYKKYVDIDKIKTSARYNVAIMYSKKGNIDNAIEWLGSSLNTINKDKDKAFFAHIHNGLAWYSLIKGDYDNIDLNSKTAYSINPNDPNFRGTRGSVLIELGKLKPGVEMLKSIMNFKFINSQTISVAMYLFYGMICLEETKKAQKYFDFVNSNKDKFDLDDEMLWNKIQSKSKELELSVTI